MAYVTCAQHAQAATEAPRSLRGLPARSCARVARLERYAEVLEVIDEVPMASHESEARAHCGSRPKRWWGWDAIQRPWPRCSQRSRPRISIATSWVRDTMIFRVRCACRCHEGVSAWGASRMRSRAARTRDMLLQACLEALGRVAEARERYEQARALHPKEPSLRCSRWRKRPRSRRLEALRRRLPSTSATRSRMRSWVMAR